jgi:hypothetical protein
MTEETQSLEEVIRQLPPALQQEVLDFAQYLLDKRTLKPLRKKLSLTWAGGLKEYRDQYTSLELQKKSLDWWGD